jgi:hypothetical protein
VQSGDTEGAVSFTIAYADTAGNSGTDVTAVSDSSSVTVDRTAPTLSSFITSVITGIFGPGSLVDISAVYSEALGATSTLQVLLNNGVSVTLSSISGSTIGGTYTVGATGSGEDKSALDISSITSESVLDLAGNVQSASSVFTNLSSSTTVTIDTTPPLLPVELEGASPPLICAKEVK